MKNKYQRMTKEEKKEIRTKFYKTDKGKVQRNRFLRLIVYGILGIILSIALIFMAIRDKEAIWEYFIPVTLFIVSIVFIIGALSINGKELNNFALKQK